AELSIAVGVGVVGAAQRRRTVARRADKEESQDVATDSLGLDTLSDESVRQLLEACAAMDQPAALPFLNPPRYREFIVNVPGDAGFDPFCLAKDLATFKWMQEAELKHARVAMLATVLWPLSELEYSALKLPFLDLSGLQLDDAPVGLALGTAALGIAIMELSKAPESPPGFYSFDPLNLKDFEMPMVGWLPQGRRWTAEAELKHGRLAMLAALAFAFTELTTKVPIIKHWPFHFS
ncbi:unnamed protein product, partial [Symbiodinium pilosum]